MRKKKEPVDLSELDKPFEYYKVSSKTEIKAGFFGGKDEDDLIIEYLGKCPNPNGVVLPHLILYFSYKYGLMNQRRLMNRLKHLIKMDLIESSKEAGVVFYKKK